MEYTQHYNSPLGDILLASDGQALTGLWFDGQKYYADTLAAIHEEKPQPVLEETKRWLDIYFQGKEPPFMPAMNLRTTAFRKAVWRNLLTIPYGQTTTYGEIAKHIAVQLHLPQISARAVGGAVSHNAISLIIPCHRVVGSDGSLTGYAGGIDRKICLLKMERTDMRKLYVPETRTTMRKFRND